MAIETLNSALLNPAGIDQSTIEKALGAAYSSQIDYLDCYFEHSISESFAMEDSIVKSGSLDINRGIGVRANSGAKAALAYVDQITPEGLLSATKAARAIASGGASKTIPVLSSRSYPILYQSDVPFAGFNSASKVDLLKTIDRYVRDLDPRIEQVMLSLSGSHSQIVIAATDGTFLGDIRPLVRLNISCIAKSHDRSEQGYAGFGGRYDYSGIFNPQKWQACAKEAVRIALLNLDAMDAPGGTMDVVLGSGWPGVLLHEAIGHGLEGDFNRKKTSAFSDKMGQEVASDLCTIVDDGTLKERRGSLSIDDEGTTTACTTLIENGKLVGYMQDKHNARLMGTQSTGNGRRESYDAMPMPRMTNTYMLPGQSKKQEMIEKVKKGIYAVNFSGGQVDITSGQFVFVANEAYLIENGKIIAPIKGASLIGDGPSTLKDVKMVGDDLAFDDGIGVCGKDGQSVPVGVGQPSMLIANMTVGGTQLA